MTGMPDQAIQEYGLGKFMPTICNYWSRKPSVLINILGDDATT